MPGAHDIRMPKTNVAMIEIAFMGVPPVLLCCAGFGGWVSMAIGFTASGLKQTDGHGVFVYNLLS